MRWDSLSFFSVLSATLMSDAAIILTAQAAHTNTGFQAQGYGGWILTPNHRFNVPGVNEFLSTMWISYPLAPYKYLGMCHWNSCCHNPLHKAIHVGYRNRCLGKRLKFGIEIGTLCLFSIREAQTWSLITISASLELLYRWSRGRSRGGRIQGGPPPLAVLNIRAKYPENRCAFFPTF